MNEVNPVRRPLKDKAEVDSRLPASMIGDRADEEGDQGKTQPRGDWMVGSLFRTTQQQAESEN